MKAELQKAKGELEEWGASGIKDPKTRKGKVFVELCAQGEDIRTAAVQAGLTTNRHETSKIARVHERYALSIARRRQELASQTVAASSTSIEDIHRKVNEIVDRCMQAVPVRRLTKHQRMWKIRVLDWVAKQRVRKDLRPNGDRVMDDETLRAFEAVANDYEGIWEFRPREALQALELLGIDAGHFIKKFNHHHTDERELHGSPEEILQQINAIVDQFGYTLVKKHVARDLEQFTIDVTPDDGSDGTDEPGAPGFEAGEGGESATSEDLYAVTEAAPVS